MLVDKGDLPLSQTVPFFFPAYNSSGASVTITGLAVTDIEIYKGTSMTERASDSGYALIDTDGIDLDTRTGIHGFSIDMSDNSDAGFYAAGSFYHIVVDAITVDSQTVRFIFAFSLGFTMRPATAGRQPVVDASGLVDANAVKVGPTGSGTAQTAGDIIGDTNDIQSRLPAALGANGNIKADVRDYNGTAGSFTGGRPEVNTTHIAGSAVSTTTAQIGVNVVQVSGDSAAADNLEAEFDGTGYMQVIDSGTAQAGASTTITLKAGSSGTDDYYQHLRVRITGGSGAGQARLIDSYVGATKIATVSHPWSISPDGTSTYLLLVASEVHVTKIHDGAITAASFAAGAIDAAAIANNAIDTATFASGTTIPRCTLVDTTTVNTDMVTAAQIRSAVGLAGANLDTQILTLATAAVLLEVQKMVEADVTIDTSVTPWDIVWKQRGTSTELLRKNLTDVLGGNITNTTTVIGNAIQ